MLRDLFGGLGALPALLHQAIDLAADVELEFTLNVIAQGPAAGSPARISSG